MADYFGKGGLSSNKKKIYPYYWKGVKAGGQEIIDGDITYAETVGRLISKDRGVNGGLTVSSDLRHLGTRGFRCEANIIFKDLSSQGIFGNSYFGAAVRWGVFIYSSRLYFLVSFTAGGVARGGSVSVSTISIDVDYRFSAILDRSGDVTLSLNGTVIITDDASAEAGIDVLFNNSFRALSFGSAGNNNYSGLSSTALMYNLILFYDEVVQVNTPLEGSSLSLDPAGNHMSPTVEALTHSYVYDRANGIASVLFVNGYDYYLDTATLTYPYYVPYNNGSPVVTSVLYMTLVSSHQQQSKALNNLAPVIVRMPDTVISGIFDRGDMAVWSNALRSTSYNSGYPFEYLLSDLVVRNMIGEVLDAHKNKIFECDDQSAFMTDSNNVPVLDGAGRLSILYDSDLTKAKLLLCYSPERTGPETIEVAQWLMKKCGNEHLPWILTTAVWVDTNIWIDSDTWNDTP